MLRESRVIARAHYIQAASCADVSVGPIASIASRVPTTILHTLQMQLLRHECGINAADGPTDCQQVGVAQLSGKLNQRQRRQVGGNHRH